MESPTQLGPVERDFTLQDRTDRLLPRIFGDAFDKRLRLKSVDALNACGQDSTLQNRAGVAPFPTTFYRAPGRSQNSHRL